MQLMIDTTTETPEGLRRIAAILSFAASLNEPAVPAGTVVAPPLPAAPVTIEGAVPLAPTFPPIGSVEVAKAPTAAEAFAKAPEVPSLPTVPTAPVVTAPAAPLAASGPVELDGSGLPHDERIHSGTPTKNANGLWRMKRGVANETIEAVEAELRANYPAPVKSAPVQVVAPLVPLPPSVPVPPLVGANAPPAPVTLPGVPTSGGAVSAPVAPGVPSGNDAFRVMMDKFSKEMGVNGRLNKTVMAPIFASLGVAGWQEFFKRPELIPGVTAEAEKLLAVA